MGKYINKGNNDFTEARSSDYVDKSELIGFVNRTLATPAKMTCVSRARRFGKSLALQMLYAYYDRSCDSHNLFDDLKIAGDDTYEKHLNKYPTIQLDISSFVTLKSDTENIVTELEQRLIDDIKTEYPNVQYSKWDTVMDVLLAVSTQTGDKFIMLIDEWDAICREAADYPQVMNQYINLLRNLFKSDNTNRVFAGVYMTGILPIKSYGTQSALNNFRMYSMTNPEPLEQYYGFTETEVMDICVKHNLDYKELAHWYNGYRLGNKGVRIFNPTSVMTVVTTRVCKGYWTQTASFESVRTLINMNFDGVKEALEDMLIEQPTKVTVTTFGNDSNEINSGDELFTLLIHYGYLGYDALNQKTFIPNWEVRQELLQAIKNGNRPELVKLIQDSENLLIATMKGDADYVAQALDKVHYSKSAPQFYNNEQALRSIIHLAYIAGIDDFVQIQELPSGKGYADIVYLPKRGSDKPALIVELKYDQSSVGAIAQIKNRKYPDILQGFADKILLVGVNYSTKSKHHECLIEQLDGILGEPKKIGVSGMKISNALSWHQVVTKLAPSLPTSWHQVAPIFARMLTNPASATELREAMGAKDRAHFRDNYINPLCSAGLIEMTDPNKRTNPKQTYQLTEQGRLLYKNEITIRTSQPINVSKTKVERLIAEFATDVVRYPIGLPMMSDRWKSSLTRKDIHCFSVSYKHNKSVFEDGKTWIGCMPDLYLNGIQSDIWRYYQAQWLLHPADAVLTAPFSKIKDILEDMNVNSEMSVICSFSLDTYDAIYGGDKPFVKNSFGYKYNDAEVYIVPASEYYMIVMQSKHLPRCEAKLFEGNNPEFSLMNEESLLYSNIHNLNEEEDGYGLCVMRDICFYFPEDIDFKFVRVNISMQ